jgi:hypothetical protein
MRIVQKKIIQTVNSEGDQRTIVNILNRRNQEAYHTRAISNKKDPSKYHVLHQSVEKKGSQLITAQKMYKMSEQDILRLFQSAETVGLQDIKKLGAIEDKKEKKEKKVIKKVMKKKDGEKKKVKKEKKEKKEKKVKKVKKMKGGENDITGFDPHRYGDMAPFQTLEQERNPNSQDVMKTLLDTKTEGEKINWDNKPSLSGGKKRRNL